MPAAPSRAAPDPPDLVAERGMPALADEQPWKQHRRLSHPRFSCDRRAGANSTMSTRPLYLLLLLHRPQGAAAFSARDAPVDEGGSGRAAAQHVGPEAAVGRKLSHLNPAGQKRNLGGTREARWVSKLACSQVTITRGLCERSELDVGRGEICAWICARSSMIFFQHFFA